MMTSSVCMATCPHIHIHAICTDTHTPLPVSLSVVVTRVRSVLMWASSRTVSGSSRLPVNSGGLSLTSLRKMRTSVTQDRPPPSVAVATSVYSCCVSRSSLMAVRRTPVHLQYIYLSVWASNQNTPVEYNIYYVMILLVQQDTPVHHELTVYCKLW